MDRLRPLDPPHKGLRLALASLSSQAGRTDFDDANSVAQLQDLWSEVRTLLDDHAHQEDAFIFGPLDRAVPGASDHSRAEHVALHASMERIDRSMRTFEGSNSNDEGHQLVLAISEFHANYLLHMIDEERTTERLLLEHVTDEQMATDQDAIMQQMQFETLLLWFKYIVPSRRVADNRAVLEIFTSAAPPEAVAAVMGVLEEVESPDRFALMTRDL